MYRGQRGSREGEGSYRSVRGHVEIKERGRGGRKEEKGAKEGKVKEKD